jgi:hypothetical protein
MLSAGGSTTVIANVFDALKTVGPTVLSHTTTVNEYVPAAPLMVPLNTPVEELIERPSGGGEAEGPTIDHL